MATPAWLQDRQLNFERGRENRASRDRNFQGALGAGIQGLNSLTDLYKQQLMMEAQKRAQAEDAYFKRAELEDRRKGMESKEKADRDELSFRERDAVNKRASDEYMSGMDNKAARDRLRASEDAQTARDEANRKAQEAKDWQKHDEGLQKSYEGDTADTMSDLEDYTAGVNFADGGGEGMSVEYPYDSMTPTQKRQIGDNPLAAEAARMRGTAKGAIQNQRAEPRPVAGTKPAQVSSNDMERIVGSFFSDPSMEFDPGAQKAKAAAAREFGRLLAAGATTEAEVYKGIEEFLSPARVE